MKRVLLAVLATPVLLSLQGCLVAAVGAGVAAGAYYWNKSETAQVEADPPIVAVAAQRALTRMGLTVEEGAATALDGKLLARTAHGDEVKVVIDGLPDGGSELTVRVGLVDEDAARRILEEILAEIEAIEARRVNKQAAGK